MEERKLINRDRVRKTFADYTDSYNSSDIKIKLKIDHTYRVAEIADRIAVSLNMSDEDRDVAWLLGMLHDVGRFEQLRRYNTFVDRDSIDHAALSADILFEEGRIRDYIDDSSEDELIEKAIRLHNVYILPENLTERERTFTDLLRDADKADILKVNCDIPLNEIYGCSMDEYKKSAISDHVLEDALAQRNVDRNYAKTPADKLVSTISFIYGVVYAESFRIIDEQGYLNEMMSFASENKDTVDKLKKIKTCVSDYMTKRM